MCKIFLWHFSFYNRAIVSPFVFIFTIFLLTQHPFQQIYHTKQYDFQTYSRSSFSTSYSIQFFHAFVSLSTVLSSYLFVKYFTNWQLFNKSYAIPSTLSLSLNEEFSVAQCTHKKHFFGYLYTLQVIFRSKQQCPL